MLGLWGLVAIVWTLAELCGLRDFVVVWCLVGFGLVYLRVSKLVDTSADVLLDLGLMLALGLPGVLGGGCLCLWECGF